MEAICVTSRSVLFDQRVARISAGGTLARADGAATIQRSRGFGVLLLAVPFGVVLVAVAAPIGTYAVGSNPDGVASAVAIHRLYVAEPGSTTLGVSDSSSGTRPASLAAGHTPMGVAVRGGIIRPSNGGTSWRH